MTVDAGGVSWAGLWVDPLRPRRCTDHVQHGEV